MAKHMKVQMQWLALAVALGLLLAACGGGDKGVAEAKKAIRAASAAQGASVTPGPDSDDYLERYQTPEQRLEARQNRLRGAISSAWAAQQSAAQPTP